MMHPGRFPASRITPAQGRLGCTEGDRGLCAPHTVHWELPVILDDVAADRVVLFER